MQVQNPIVLPTLASELQPDVALLRLRPDFYSGARPGPADVFLVVDVMDSSVERDRRVKLPLYARAGIDETWLVNPMVDHIEVHRRPTAEGYRDVRILRPGEPLAVAAYPDIVFTAEDVLGRAGS